MRKDKYDDLQEPSALPPLSLILKTFTFMEYQPRMWRLAMDTYKISDNNK